jgi:hypothetical protein
MEMEGAGAVLGGSSDDEGGEYDNANEQYSDSGSERSVSPEPVASKKAKVASLDEEEDEEALALRLLTGGR